MKRITAVILSVLSLPVLAQDASPTPFALKKPDFKIEPYAQLQGWAVHSIDRKAETNGRPGLDNVDSRTNFFFRRARVGFRGSPYKNLKYQLSLYYDNAGHDSLANTRASTLPNTSSGRESALTKGVATVGLWDSFLSWKLTDSDLFHITAGYFRPQISRESITAAFNVNSFEKAPSQNYVRQAVIGRGFGRGTGINLGGLQTGDKVSFNYNLGIFNKVTTGDKFTEGSTDVTLAETQGDENSLVYVARFAMSFGDPEMTKYGLGYTGNYFGKRKGLTLALNGSTQSRTPRYRANEVVGADFLFNWGMWNADGEFFYIYNKANQSKNYAKSRTGHFRLGRLFSLSNGTYLEPSFMVSGFYGEKGSQYTGRDTVYDVGINWYLDQNRYKFYAHYVWQDGDGNNLVHRDGVFHYGDYAGIGLTLQF